jgi:hypothetical protein
MQRKFLIIYQTDNNDLYSEEECSTQDDVDAWLADAEHECFRSYVVEVTGYDLTIKAHPHT